MRIRWEVPFQKAELRRARKFSGRKIWLAVAAGLALGGAAIAFPILRLWRSETPTQPQAAQNAISDLRWNQMVTELENSVQKFPGRVGIVIKDLRTGREWNHEADRLFPSASLIKLPIMAAVFRKIKEGGLTLETQLRLQRKDRMSGSGRLKWHNAGVSFTVRDLLYYMISDSDNTAMRILLNNIGIDYFQKQFRDMGLLVTNIEEEGLRLSSRPVLRENYTTAREISEILEQIYQGKMVDEESSRAMLDLLKSLRYRERLARTLPPGWQLAHKTGLLRRACHDAGIVFSPEGDYVLVVLTWKAPDYKSAKNYISNIGKITYRYFSGESNLASGSSHSPGL